MKNLQILIIIIATLALIGCQNSSNNIQNDTNNTNNNEVQAAGMHFNISIKNKKETPINVVEESLSKELKDYILENIPAHNDERFLAQLDPAVGIKWIDFETEQTKQYNAPFDDQYISAGTSTISPDGKYIAMNLTKGIDSKWSKLILINTENNTYETILSDEILLTPKENCEELTIVKQRSKEDELNECVISAPQSVYLLDQWSDNNTLEITKHYFNKTTYSLDVR